LQMFQALTWWTLNLLLLFFRLMFFLIHSFFLHIEVLIQQYLMPGINMKDRNWESVKHLPISVKV
jgi:hypothetical protein